MWGGGGGGLLTSPYPLKVQACPPRVQRPALRSRVLGQEKKDEWGNLEGLNSENKGEGANNF